MKDFGPAFGVANAVLYEGYLLFPYTASTPKNRVRWQFGVVVPEAYLAAETGEHAEQQTEVIFEHACTPDIDVLLRFLQVEDRNVEAARGTRFEPVASLEIEGTMHLSFEEAVEREVRVNVRPAGSLQRRVPLHAEGGRDVEALRDSCGVVRGQMVRVRRPLHGALEIEVAPIASDGPHLSKLQVRVANRSDLAPGERSAALRTSFVSTHVLLAIEGGRFLSVLDPPPYASAATAHLANRHAFPVLVGDGKADAQRAALVLSSPIILYDFPELGAQTEADAFDATEIDELLTLSVLSLSDAERAEACATDPRARAIVERAERFGPEAIARLHAGSLQRSDEWPAFERLADPLAGSGLDLPAIDFVFVAGTKVARGSSVRLHPKGRADSWDLMLDGKLATVRAIHQDFEDKMYVAVTVDDDPASDLHEWYGRAFFFSPEEVEPLPARGAG
jgi:hypothetical protein